MRKRKSPKGRPTPPATPSRLRTPVAPPIAARNLSAAVEMSNRPRTRSTTQNDRLRDRLSELPLDIIHNILDHVPTRDAVRMCVLSTQWRYTWTSLPSLVFIAHGDEKFDMSTKKIITNVLHHHKGPIHTFKVSYPGTSGSRTISVENWLLRLASKDVRNLFLRVSSSCVGSLKSNLYKCLKLAGLSVWLLIISPPPSTFKGFLFLTSILLVGAELSTAGFESLVRHCPVLEYMELLACSIDDLTICSPNLKLLHIEGCHAKLSLHAPKLDQIHVGLSLWRNLYDTTVCNYFNVLGSCTNLVVLNGDHYFTRYLSVGLESSHPTLVFHHLEAIELRGLRFTNTSDIAVVARLIKDAPNLEEIELDTYYGQAAGAPDVSFREYFGFAPSFTLEKLKDVKLICVCDYPTGVQLTKFLLESSPLLETMEIQLASSNVNRVSAEVLRFEKASPIAMVTFVGISNNDPSRRR